MSKQTKLKSNSANCGVLPLKNRAEVLRGILSLGCWGRGRGGGWRQGGGSPSLPGGQDSPHAPDTHLGSNRAATVESETQQDAPWNPETGMLSTPQPRESMYQQSFEPEAFDSYLRPAAKTPTLPCACAECPRSSAAAAGPFASLSPTCPSLPVRNTCCTPVPMHQPLSCPHSSEL